jgi:hypothetical protein
MGNTLANHLLKNCKLSPGILFLKDYLTHEKIQILKSINDDYLFDEETFCSFFSCEENYFKFFDTNDTGLINVWELLLTIYLLKNDVHKTKINNILSLFIHSPGGNVINQSEVYFMNECYFNVIQRLFEINFNFTTVFDECENDNTNELSMEKIIHENEKYVKNLFKIDLEIKEEVSVSYIKR